MSNTYISEIHELLKLGGQPDSHFNGASEGLPVMENDGGSGIPHIPDLSHSGQAAIPMEPIKIIRMPAINWKGLLVYPAIFLAAFMFFYLALNFPSMLSQMQGFFSPPQTQQILGSDQAEYFKWISNYFYAVGDPQLLNPNNDIDKDGLSNYDEFVMRTNPIVADSDSDAFSDGIEVINSTNPWGSGNMNANQKKLADKLNLILINNRVSFNEADTHPTVAGAKTVNIDQELSGTLSIPKLKISVPLIWSKDPLDFDADLTRGVIHYPGTALPGENGIIYVSGHSSDYIWKKDPMQNIFSKLNFLAAGDDVFVDVVGSDGKVQNFRYSVTGNHIYHPNDQGQFFDPANMTSILNLSTCWPIGTSKDRIVVSAVQVGL